jgi:hypothetical protein
MNGDICFNTLRDRLKRHYDENLEEFDFVNIFPELKYFERHNTKDAIHIANWFQVEDKRLVQISAYGNTPKFILLLIEPILHFDSILVNR